MQRIVPLPVKTPKLLQRLYPDALWHLPPGNTKKIFLTFDDGPHPEATSFVLEQLKKHEATATFFCVGNNITKHTDIFKKAIDDGHSIGNHTLMHNDGWRTKVADYLNAVEECQNIIHNFLPAVEKPLFRPPYGRLRPLQYRKLKNSYRVVMWDVLSYDFDHIINGAKVFNNVIKHAHNGSIVVMHDSAKAFKNISVSLPLILDYFSSEGWQYGAL